MEIENPFGDTQPEHYEVLMAIINFWKLVPMVVGDMIVMPDAPTKLVSITHELHAQVLTMMEWFSPTDARPVSVSDMYKILFFMREKTQPVMVELQEAAESMDIDLRVPYQTDSGEIIDIELCEWIPKRLIRF